MPLDLIAVRNNFKKVSIYENKTSFYFIGTNSKLRTYNIITIKKIDYDLKTYDHSLKDLLTENKKTLSYNEVMDIFAICKKKEETKLYHVCDSLAIFGFIKFMIGYYAIVITKDANIAKIGQHKIKRVDNYRIIVLYNSNEHPLIEMENKYLSIFKNCDIIKQTYFSHTYNLTKTLQQHFVEGLKSDFYINWDYHYHNDDTKKLDIEKMTRNIFLWNNFHVSEMFDIVENKVWFTWFIYGYIAQNVITDHGLIFAVTIIARRNRNFAGTRYLKRGISDEGHVANDVETEQILEELTSSCADKPLISSYIHIRGSVPIYWYQETTTLNIKPEVRVNYFDIHYESTQKHFGGLVERYGFPIIACNLTKKAQKFKSESLLNVNYEGAVNYINNLLPEEQKIQYYHFDVKMERRHNTFYRKFFDIAQGLIEKTNIFSFLPHIRNNKTFSLILQEGVIRSNCVDCLDRTNVFQQVIGIAILFNQLKRLGLNLKEPKSDTEDIYGVLTDLYKNMGHEISLQYAGSSAHKQNINKDNKNAMVKIINKFPEVFNVFKRYFNNSFNDQYKQAAINLFLGKYQPKYWKFHLWEYSNDVVFHQNEKYNHIKELLLTKFRGWINKAYSIFKEFSLIDDILNHEKILSNPTIYYNQILNEVKIISSNNEKKNSFFVNLLNYKKSIERLRNVKKNSVVIFKEESKLMIKSFEKKIKNELSPTKPHLQFGMRPKNEMKKTDYLTEIKKIFTFEIDNEINVIQEFLDPDPQTLLNSEYSTIDKFLTMDIKAENYKEIFEEEKEETIVYDKFCKEKISTELADDMKKLFDNKLKKKDKNNAGESMNDGVIIYNIDEKQFYRKLNKNNEMGIIPGNDSSPKTLIKVKRMPWNINDEYFL